MTKVKLTVKQYLQSEAKWVRNVEKAKEGTLDFIPILSQKTKVL
jgi:hypothetical protein